MEESSELQPYDSEGDNQRVNLTAKEVREGGKWLIRAQLAVAGATIVLVIFNGFTVWLTYKQIAAVRTSIEENQRQFNQSQRPWVGVTHYQITNVEVGKKPHAVVRVTNRGATPAKVRTRVFISLWPGMPKELSYKDPLIISDVILPLNTGIDTPADFPRELSKQDMVAINDGKLVLHTYGHSEYEDLRGNTYRTNFCFFWNPKEKKYFLCPDHNDFE